MKEIGRNKIFFYFLLLLLKKSDRFELKMAELIVTQEFD